MKALILDDGVLCSVVFYDKLEDLVKLPLLSFVITSVQAILHHDASTQSFSPVFKEVSQKSRSS